MPLAVNKIHRPLAAAVVSTLQAVMIEARGADKLLAQQFRSHPQWGSRDRRFVAEAVYEIIRWWRRLWYALDREAQLDLESLETLLAAWILLRGEEPPAWLALHDINKKNLERRYSCPPSEALRFSLPDWLMGCLRQELGLQGTQIAEELNRQAPVFLRANRLLTSSEILRSALASENIEAEVVDRSEALRLVQRAQIFKSKAFKQGLFEIQDLHSQKVADFLQVEPGHRVIDACAGAGGKSLHVAALMKNQGRIIALDVAEHKLEELRLRARRARATVIEARPITSTKVIKRLANSADRVLLDVPCTGTGVLRRHPERKWRLSLEDLERLLLLQAQIFAQYSMMMKAGGKLVYATCSVLPSENQQQVSQFLSSHPEWVCEEQQFLAPSEGGGDGFFMARLRLSGPAD